MNTTLKSLLVGVLLFIFSPNTQAQSGAAASTGTEFWAGYGFIQYMSRKPTSIDTYYGLSLFISSPNNPSVVSIDIPALPLAIRTALGFPRNYTIPADSTAEIKGFPIGDITDAYNKAGLPDARLYYTGVTPRGISIKSTNGVPISVVEYLWSNNNSVASTLLSPISSLSSNYIVQSYGGKSNTNPCNSYFFVIANQDSTNVMIVPAGNIIDSSTSSIFTNSQRTPSIKYAQGQPFYITLNKGQVFNAMSIIDSSTLISSDLSGTTIQTDSTKTIAVFGGNGRVLVDTSTTYPQIVRATSGSDNLIQQMLPSSVWGTKYLTTPTKTMEFNYYRIYVKDASTNVYVNGVLLNKSQLCRGSYYQLSGNRFYSITGDAPISVNQFIVAGGLANNSSIGNSGLGDPEMIELTPLDKGVKNFTGYSMNFKTGTGGATYINVVIPKSGIASFYLNDKSLVDTGASSYSPSKVYASDTSLIATVNSFRVHPADSNYYFARYKIPHPGTFKVSSTTPFTGIAYGLFQGESWGYTLGYDGHTNQLTIDSFYLHGCSTVSYKGRIYDSSTRFVDTIKGFAGNDSVYHIIHTSIRYPSSKLISQTTCNSYTWHNNTYTSSGTYTYDTLNAVGCDSLTTLKLTINKSSTDTLYVTVNDSYTWHGNTYTQSGTYVYDTLNAIGCDSLTVLVLSIPSPSIISFNPPNGPIGTTVTIKGTHFNNIPDKNIVYFGAVTATVLSGNDSILTVTSPAGATYQPISVTTNGLTAYAATPFITTFNGGVGQTITANSFSPKVDYAGPNHSVEAIADIDGDGKPDIISTSGGLSIFRNTTTKGILDGSSFTIRIDSSVSGTYPQPRVADLDGDGKLDIMVTYYDGIAVYKNTSTVGNISFAPKKIINMPQHPSISAISDIDGDGKPDIIMASYYYANTINYMSILRNTSSIGNISFDTAVNYTYPSKPYYNVSLYLAVSDIDGDGKRDIALAGFDTISFFRNVATPGSITSSSFTMANMGTNNAGSIALNDLDDDGKPELLFVPCCGFKKVLIYKNQAVSGNIATSSFANPVSFNFLQGGTAGLSAIPIGDVDGDGKPDIVFGADTSRIVILQNTTTKGVIDNTSFASVTNIKMTYSVGSLAVGDLDADGKPEIIFSDGASVGVMKNTISRITPLITSFTPTSTCPGTSATVFITGTNFIGVTSVKVGGNAVDSFKVNSATSITAYVRSGLTGVVSVVTINDTATSTISFTNNGGGFTAYAYIANRKDYTVSVINTVTNAILATVPLGYGGSPLNVFASKDGTKVFVSIDNDSVKVINTLNNKVVSTLSSVRLSFGFVASPDGTRLYIAGSQGDSMLVLNTLTNKKIKMIKMGFVQDMCISPDGGKIYITDNSNNSVYVFSTATNTIIDTISVGVPNGIAISPNGSIVYVTNFYNNSVTVINAISNTVTSTIKVGLQPYGVCVSPDGNTLYVANNSDSTVSVINTSTNAVIKTISVGNYPIGIGVTPDGTKAYVTYSSGQTVSVINTSTNTIQQTIGVGQLPSTIDNFIANVPNICPVFPAITSFAPINASAGETVTIKGSGFMGTTAISFGDSSATSFTIINDSTITAIVGGGANGYVYITNPIGKDSLAGFSYCSGVQPSVIIKGRTSITSNTSVTFTATPTNGGRIYSFQWYKNGSSIIGATTSTYTSSTLLNNDSVWVVLNSSATCRLSDTAISNKMHMYVSDAIITNFAGNGTASWSGDGGLASAASLNNPYSVAVDLAGNVYIAEQGNNDIRKVSANGIISTIVGTGTATYSGDGAAATAASINAPTSVAVDKAGNIYIADNGNNRVRKVDTKGIITTVAGNGTAAYTGDGGLATAASLNGPKGIAIDTFGNLYIAEYNTSVIRMVNNKGIISTIAGNGNLGYSGDGGLATSAELFFPNCVAVDNAGSLYIADSRWGYIRKVNIPTGIITKVVGNGSGIGSGDGGLATKAGIYGVTGMTVDAYGNLFIADWWASRIRIVGPDGIINSVAGNGSGSDNGPAVKAKLYQPTNVAIDALGNLFICDASNNHIRKVKVNNGTLPVSFSLFTANVNGINVETRWQTATELNTSHFIIQRSTDGGSFTDIGTVKAIGSGANGYQFTDNKPTQGINYYRLKSVDKDGGFSYSKIVSVQFTVNSNQLSVFPNPSKDKVTVLGNHIASVQVVDNLGRVLKIVSFKDASNPVLTLAGMAAGVYHLRVQTTDGKVSGANLVVN